MPVRPTVAAVLALLVLAAGCLRGEDAPLPPAPAPAAETPRVLGAPAAAGEARPCGLAIRVEPARIVSGDRTTVTVTLRNCSTATLRVLGDACGGLPGVVLTRDGETSGSGSSRDPWILDDSGPAGLAPRVCGRTQAAPWDMPSGHAYALELAWTGQVPVKMCPEDDRCDAAGITIPPGSYHFGVLVRVAAPDGTTETLKNATALEVWSPTLVDVPLRALASGEAPNDDAAELVLDTEREWERFTTRADAPAVAAPDFASERVVAIVLGLAECRAPVIVDARTDAARNETLVRWRDVPVDGCAARSANAWIAAALPADATRVTIERVPA